MTPSTTAAAGASVAGDAFAQDALPAPPGASRALLASLLRPHRRRLTATCLVLTLQRALSQVGPLLVAYTIDRAVPALRDGDHGPLLGVCLVYALVVAGSAASQYGYVRLSARAGQDVLLDLLTRVFRHSQALGLDFHERYGSGRLTARATGDIGALRGLLAKGLEDIVGAALTTVCITGLLLHLDRQLGLAAVTVGAPLYLTVRSFRRRATRVHRDRSSAAAAVTGALAETLHHIRVVQAFRLEAAGDASFREIDRRHARLSGDATLEMGRYVTSSRLVANTGIAVLALWGAHRVASGSLELGAFTAAVLYLRRLYDDPLKLGGVLDAYQSAVASLEKIAALLAQRPSVSEPAAPARLPANSPAGRGRRAVLDGVTFAYGTGGEVLPRLDLSLAAGETVAVVGATGAGKSTLAGLLARFHDPTHGRVLLDGVDLRHLATAELRRAVVMVTQDAFVFSGTVAENIAVGRPGADRADIERVARAVGAHAFVSALPEEYDTDVRARGTRISAGQRQLLALARALLADPDVVILDEATSSLDIPGERLVQRAMRTVLEGRTALVVAHRLSTLRIADRVVVMDGGRVVEDGTPAELIERRGRFADLHTAWRNSLT
ncbi:ABC transporter ATP-binding protein [Streptomyces avicenniae]|uniref:ABC transporter ATP-binding protein n=1 Tax=Streptomyces avicenniae TaxID=500153 RepID=UPI00069AB88C|nr:ABC transporter ATP-binding protein [Streptomyces avicenniae]